MKLTDIIGGGKPGLSFEVFPPKNSVSRESVHATAIGIARLGPGYMSVTYGAGGSTDVNTVSLASDIQNQAGVPALAHLTCINSTRSGVRSQLQAMRAAGIENVLALRGDMAEGAQPERWDFRFAGQLVAEIRAFGGFCIGGACYPEVHPDSPNQMQDIAYLKQKVDAGCEFLTTQMFFDNNTYYNFLYKIREAGITVPVVPGIMPVTNGAQIKRIASMCGATLPQRFRYIVDRFGGSPATMRQAGIAYATEQIIDLFANGVQWAHVYSMNNPAVAAKIMDNLSEIIK